MNLVFVLVSAFVFVFAFLLPLLAKNLVFYSVFMASSAEHLVFLHGFVGAQRLREHGPERAMGRFGGPHPRADRLQFHSLN